MKLETRLNFKNININLIKVFLGILVVFGATKPAQAQSADGPIYIVQPGDSLLSIASRFNVSMTDLMTANSLADANSLFIGQQLVIPGLPGVSGTLETQDVIFGDSLRGLLRQTQAPLDLLVRVNRLVSPSELFIGSKIILPVSDQVSGKDQISIGPGETLLEAAIRNQSDPWTIIHTNHLSGTWQGLAGDPLVIPAVDGNQYSSLPASIEFAEFSGPSIEQGGTAVIRIKAAEGVTLGGFLVDKPLHFYPTGDGTQVALQGVHARLDSGLYPLRLDITHPDGRREAFQQMVQVSFANYQTGESLPVDPSLIDPAVTDPEQKQLEAITLPSNPQKFWSGQFISPASNYADTTYPTSDFGTSRVYIGQGTELQVQWWHTGIDFGGGTGLPINSPAAGQVVFADFLTVRGNATIIDHGWGVYSGFWHQSEIQVQPGEMVQQGQVIGLVGGTGRVTGPHLHWEIWVNGVQVNPYDWLNKPYP